MWESDIGIELLQPRPCLYASLCMCQGKSWQALLRLLKVIGEAVLNTPVCDTNFMLL